MATFIDKWHGRTAASKKDYVGGENNETSFEDCETVIDDLLNKEHRERF